MSVITVVSLTTNLYTQEAAIHSCSGEKSSAHLQVNAKKGKES